MGVDFYIVIPKLKIKIHAGRHVSEEDLKEHMEELNKVIDNNTDGKYDVDLESATYKNFKIKEMARLIAFHEDATYLLTDQFINNILVFKLLQIFPDAKLVADCSEEYTKYLDYETYRE